MNKGPINMAESNGLEQRFTRVEDQFSEMQGQLGQVVASVGKLEVGIATTNETVRSLAQTVQAVSNRQNERIPTNWTGLISVVFAGVGVLAAFVTMRVLPTEARVERVHSEVRAERLLNVEQAAELARQGEALRWLEKDHDRRQASP